MVVLFRIVLQALPVRTSQMGSITKTQQNLEVVRVDEERNMILLKGCVPGSKGADVIIRPAVKKSVKK